MKMVHDNLLRVGLGIALVIFMLIGGIFYWTTNGMKQTNRMVEQTQEVLESLSVFLTGIHKGESAARGFVMSGKADHLEIYRDSVSEVQKAIQNLERLVANNPRQKARLEAIKSAVHKKNEFSKRKIQLRQSSGRESAIDFFLTGQDHTLMNTIRSLVSEMKAEEITLLQQRQAQAEYDAQRSLYILITGFTLGFAILLSVYYYLNREIILRTEAEAEAVRLNRDLERRVKERTSELADVNKQLEERNREVEHANRMKSEFLASMSHELRTPLNAIIGFSDLLAEESAGPLSDKQRRFINHVSAGARHLMQLINDVLDVSKIEAGRIELNKTDFAVAEATLEVVSLITPLAESKGIRVDNTIQSNLNVHADRIRFKQIFYNLLNNALKFTQEKGMVRIDAFDERDFVRFCVSDTGIGIPPEELHEIFDEFHQVGGTTKNVNQGTGLGLTITKRLVELHGGRIWAESKLDCGSQFNFTIPVVPVA